MVFLLFDCGRAARVEFLGSSDLPLQHLSRSWVFRNTNQ